MATVDTSEYQNMPYVAEVGWEKDEDGEVIYVAQHPELPGCMAQGSSPEAALESLQAARKLYIATLIKYGVDVPRPQGSNEQATTDPVIRLTASCRVIHQPPTLFETRSTPLGKATVHPQYIEPEETAIDGVTATLR